MTDKERWIRNEKLIAGAADRFMVRKFTDVVKAMEALGWEPRVLEVRRGYARQLWLRARGYSKTLKSKHLGGWAMDVIEHPLSQENVPVHFMADLAIIAHKQGLQTGALWGLDGIKRAIRQEAIEAGDAERLTKLLTWKRGWDPCHVEVPG